MPVALKSPVPRAATRLDSNRLELADRAGHDWYRFVLSFPPHLVRQYLDRFELSEDSTVLDPFCRTGTIAIVRAKLSGRPITECNVAPFSTLVNRVKTKWHLDVHRPRETAKPIVEHREQLTTIHWGAV